jgi:hypothetical protein
MMELTNELNTSTPVEALAAPSLEDFVKPSKSLYLVGWNGAGPNQETSATLQHPPCRACGTLQACHRWLSQENEPNLTRK